MKDGDFEATHFGETWIDVERAVGNLSALFLADGNERLPDAQLDLLVITTQTIDTSLLFGRLFLHNNIGRPSRRLVGRGAGAPVRRLLLPAEPAAAPEKDGRFVVENVLARLGVGRCDAVLDDSRVALVNDLDELGLGDQAARRRHGILADLEILLAVQEHHGAKVGYQRVIGEGSFGVEGRNYAVCWQNLEVFGSLTEI